jgi:8-oxo-dGTP diphosphatase
VRDRGSAVIIENNKVALIERVKDGITYYVFPGGGIEAGETPEEATKREAYEELGVTIKVNECFATVNYNGKQYFFMAEILEGVFGTGQGEEFKRNTSERGTYKPMWIDIDQSRNLDIKPIQIAEKLQIKYKGKI